MLFRQVIHEDLGCASYLVGDVGEGIAAVVDPQWDIEPYLHLSRLHGVRIEHVLETHNHADHVSGHGRLARATGATIHINRLADAEYPHEAFDDGWILRLGEVEIEAVHTPGHRPEHTSFVVRDIARRRRAGRRPHRRLAVRRRRRPPRPRGRARGGRPRPVPLAARAPAQPARRASRSGPATSAARSAAARASTTGPRRRSASSSRTTTSSASPPPTRSSPTRSRTLGDRPPNVEHVVDLNRGPLVEELGAPAPLSPRAVEVAIAGGRAARRRAHQRPVRRGPHPGAISASAYDTGFATKVAQGRPAGRRADRRRRLRRLRARRRRPARLGRPARARLSRRRDDRLALGGPPGQPARADRPRRSSRSGSRPTTSWSCSTSATRPSSRQATSPARSTSPTARSASAPASSPPSRPIATVCSGGKRCGLAASLLQREGFDQRDPRRQGRRRHLEARRPPDRHRRASPARTG